jgi:hypothetical protein
VAINIVIYWMNQRYKVRPVGGFSLSCEVFFIFWTGPMRGVLFG